MGDTAFDRSAHLSGTGPPFVAKRQLKNAEIVSRRQGYAAIVKISRARRLEVYWQLTAGEYRYWLFVGGKRIAPRLNRDEALMVLCGEELPERPAPDAAREAIALDYFFEHQHYPSEAALDRWIAKTGEVK